MGTFDAFGPYKDALAALGQLPNADSGFDYQTAISKLEITPGLFFTPGTSWKK